MTRVREQFLDLVRFIQFPQNRPKSREDIDVLKGFFTAVKDRSGGIKPVAYEGSLWVCDYKTKIWNAFDREMITKIILHFGVHFVATKPLNMTIHRAAALANAICNDYDHSRPSFFRYPNPRIFHEGHCIEVLPDGEIKREPITVEHGARYVLTGFGEPSSDDLNEWEEYLNSLFLEDTDREEKKECLAQFIGACLGGVATKYDTCIILTGEGSNGKSQFSWAFQQLFHEDVKCALEPGMFSEQFMRAMLPGKLLNIASEIPGKKLIDSTYVKAVFSGEDVTASFKYRTPFTFRPIAGHLFSCNNLPDSVDNSEGFWRRFITIPFNRTFTPDGSMSKEELQQKLMSLRGAMLYWAVEGLRDLTTAKSYTIPEGAERAKTAWKAESADSITAWIAECVTGDDKWVKSSQVYKHYKEWCEETCNVALPIQKFSPKLRKLGYERKRTKHAMLFKVTIG